jgi:amino acid permease
MKRWESRDDASKARFSACGSLVCGAVVVFLPRLVPPDGFVNGFAQLILLVLALMLAFSAGVHTHKAYPHEDW